MDASTARVTLELLRRATHTISGNDIIGVFMPAWNALAEEASAEPAEAPKGVKAKSAKP